MPHTVDSDTGPFATVPEWILFGELSDRAVRLFAVLQRHDGEQGAFPSRKRLATILACSLDSVDRAVKELEQQNIVIRHSRFNESGGRRSNLYELRLGLAAPMRPPNRTHTVDNESNGKKSIFNNFNNIIKSKVIRNGFNNARRK
tara:strand:- start:479 stop:913 length:435 start_codon:yes stop_codon:yes gene_type:complete